MSPEARATQWVVGTMGGAAACLGYRVMENTWLSPVPTLQSLTSNVSTVKLNGKPVAKELGDASLQGLPSYRGRAGERQAGAPEGKQAAVRVLSVCSLLLDYAGEDTDKPPAGWAGPGKGLYQAFLHPTALEGSVGLVPKAFAVHAFKIRHRCLRQHSCRLEREYA